MKKKKISKNVFALLLALLLFGFSAACAPTVIPPEEIDTREDLGEYGRVVLSFASVSDVHFSSVNDASVKVLYPRALSESQRLTGNRLDAVIVTGDFSEGYLKDYDTLINYTKLYAGQDIPLIASYGNHEGDNKHSQYETKFGLPVDNVRQVKGFTFICVGAHAGDTYLESQRDWLDEKLAEAEAPGKADPAFVLVHHPVYDTTNKDTGNPMLRPALDKHPHAFTLSGHNHNDFSENSLWKGGFIAFENSYIKGETSGKFAVIRVTDKNMIIIKKYSVSLDHEQVTYLENDYVIDYKAFLDSKT